MAATPVTELELSDFEILDPELNGARFHQRIDELRTEGWLARHPLGVVVLEREAGEVFLRSKSVAFPMEEIARIFGIEGGPLREEMDRNIIGLEGAEHGRLRQLVNPFFTPKAAQRHRPAMRSILERLTAPLVDAGGGEFISAVARPYPALMIAHVLGDPDADPEPLARWSTVVQRQFDAGALATGRAEIEEAVVELYAYLQGLLERRRAEPGDDLVSQLLAAEAEGDRLSLEEVLNLAGNVLIGGIDTTQSQLAQAVRLFAAHPEQWALLAERPELAPAAVEEALRFEPATPFTARTVRQDMELRDVLFPAGTVVLVAAVAGNRDTEPDPDSFDITADRGRTRLLTFGAGIHFCLGANLAKAELEEALTYLPPLTPGLRLAAEPEFDSVTGIYGVRTLDIAFDTP